jgi:hypothetical protein
MADDPALSRGFLFAATGRFFFDSARIAAQTVRRLHPGIPIDIFTDIDEPHPCFDRVVLLDEVWHRAKIDAMIASRFERTLFLDADVFVVGEVRDVFDLLDRFDLALAQDQEQNSAHARAVWRRPMPAAFPQYNSGVFAYRRTDAVLGLLSDWRAVVRAAGGGRDQPSLRELLWDSDLRIATLPPEYNYASFTNLALFRQDQIAPRIIHNYRFKTGQAAPAAQVEAVLGPAKSEILSAMLAADRYLAETEGRSPQAAAGRRKRWLQVRAMIEVLSGRPGKG